MVAPKQTRAWRRRKEEAAIYPHPSAPIAILLLGLEVGASPWLALTILKAHEILARPFHALLPVSCILSRK